MSKSLPWDRKALQQNFLLFLLYAIALFPLLQVGFAAEDDIDLYCNCFAERWANLSDFSQGRFYLVFMRYLFAVPYLIDSHLWLSLCRIIPIALCFVAFISLIKRTFKSQSITLFCALFLACFMQILGYHSVTTAYPFYFTTGFLLVLCSLHLLWSYYEREKKKWLYFSAIIMVVASLFYESFFMYYVIVLFIVLFKNKPLSLKSKERLIKVVKELLPFFIGGCLYIVAYLTFRHFNPPTYKGLLFPEHLTLWGVLKSATDMTKGAFPLFSYSSHISFLRSQSLFSDGTFAVLRADLSSYIMGLLAVVLLVVALQKYKDKITYKILALMFLAGVLFIYLPVLPVSIGEKYYLTNLYNYVPTFFSFFGYALLFCSVVFALENLLAFNKWILYTFRGCLCVLVFCGTVSTQMINTAMCKDLRGSQIRIDMASDVFKNNIIPHINTHTPICLEQLHKTTSIQGENMTWQATYWWQFFHKKTFIHYDLCDKYEDFRYINKKNNSIVWTAFFKQTTKDEDALLYFAANNGSTLPQRQEDIICDSLVCLYHSPYKTFNVTVLTSSESDSLWLNGSLMQSEGCWHNLDISFPLTEKKENSQFVLSGSGIVAASLQVSNIPMNNLSDRNKKINEIIQSINGTPEWLESVKQKAKAKNISLQRAVAEDALWVYEQQNKH